MAVKQQISPNQATYLVIAGGVGIVFFWIVEASVPVAGRDAWMSFIIGYGLGIPIAFSLIALNRRFPGKNLLEYAPLIIGRPLGYLYIFIYVITYTYFTALILNLSINMISLFYPETPGIVLTAVSVLLLAYVAKMGIEVFGRACEIFVPLIILAIFFIILNVIPFMDVRRLAPVLEHGLMPVIELVPHTVSFVGEYIIFMALWLPLLNNINKATRVVVVGTITSALVLVSVLITSIMVFGVELGTTLAFSAVKLTLLSVLPGVEGLPTLTLGIWIIAAFVKGTVFFFPSVMGAAQLFNLRDYRVLVWPMVLVVATLSLLPDNYFASLAENLTLGLYFSLPIILSIPLLLVIAKIRKIGESTNK